jgi:competence protein ComEA helix-hairpin-helix repeat region
MFNILEYIKDNYMKIIIFVIVLVFVVGGGLFYYSNHEKDNGEVNIFTPKKDEEIVGAADIISDDKDNNVNIVDKVYVDIKGHVNKPGVYEIDKNKRIYNVIELAGGLSANADTSVINLARVVYDSMVIVIYSKDEVTKFEEVKAKEVVKEAECKIVNTVINNNACTNVNDKNTGNVDVITKNDNDKADGNDKDVINKNIDKISLNTATKEQLMTLSGVGESKADLIIKYREDNGGFKNIEELMNISGIGEATFEKLKDSITI